jgi:hypothetical protein
MGDAGGFFDEDYSASAATQSFDAKCAGSGIEVENFRFMVEIGLEKVEKGEFLASTHRVSEGGFGRAKPLSFIKAGDDAQIGGRAGVRAGNGTERKAAA